MALEEEVRERRLDGGAELGAGERAGQDDRPVAGREVEPRPPLLHVVRPGGDDLLDPLAAREDEVERGAAPVRVPHLDRPAEAGLVREERDPVAPGRRRRERLSRRRDPPDDGEGARPVPRVGAGEELAVGDVPLREEDRLAGHEGEPVARRRHEPAADLEPRAERRQRVGRAVAPGDEGGPVAPGEGGPFHRLEDDRGGQGPRGPPREDEGEGPRARSSR